MLTYVAPHKEKAADLSASGKSHKFGHLGRIEKLANQPRTAAWASAIPTPKKMALPMIVPKILLPMVVMSALPQFDDRRIGLGISILCAPPHNKIRSSISSLANYPDDYC